MKRIASTIFELMIEHVISRRSPDFTVGARHPEGAYLHRWYLTPWRRLFRDVDAPARTRWQRLAVWLSSMAPNIYLHEFLRDDDDRALHDHPGHFWSLILFGSYVEHTIEQGGVHVHRQYDAGTLRFVPRGRAHRIELLRKIVDNGDSIVRREDPPAKCWTLVVTVCWVKPWGFHCPERGWIPFQRFTAKDNTGELGAGCDG
ncbi:hypothetical protein LJR143_002202 [Pseudoxanthomonas sp. LjRoot143]|uniref:hypothetical protein n=1 Tax=Pseudoxanthomonas sp. LjRoot143 TaxID=3342266 RepID=UPI003ED07529